MDRHACLLAAALLAGCSTSVAPHYEATFGDAVRDAGARQTLNPGAASNDTVSGMDGAAVHDAQDRYHQTFREPPPPVNTITINAGTPR